MDLNVRGYNDFDRAEECSVSFNPYPANMENMVSS